jgi:transposase
MDPLTKRLRAAQAAAVVGVDAGKFTHTLVVRPRDQADSRALRVATTRAGFDEAVAFIERLAGGAPPAEVLVGLEFAGNYGFTFAHYLHAQHYDIVSVLPAHTKRWKEVTHHLPLKTDAKDALGIVDLTAHGHFVGFPFLGLPYAELRYLVSARERLRVLHRGALTRLRTILHVVFPEFEQLFGRFTKRTPLALLAAFPGPGDLLAAPKRRVLAVLHEASQGHLGTEKYAALCQAAHATLGLPGAQGVLREEIPLLLEQWWLVERQRRVIEAKMQATLAPLPEAPALLSIPLVAPVTAAVFLGSIGDPQAYSSAREVLKVAGLSLVERSSPGRAGRALPHPDPPLRGRHHPALPRGHPPARPGAPGLGRRPGLRAGRAGARRGPPAPVRGPSPSSAPRRSRPPAPSSTPANGPARRELNRERSRERYSEERAAKEKARPPGPGFEWLRSSSSAYLLLGRLCSR